MKPYTMFCWDFLFGDHMTKVSNKAKLYFVKLCFFADHGFVANPISILKSLGYDKTVYDELVENEELLVLENRSEVFIASYFVHNKFGLKEWLNSHFSIYWKGKLWIKDNGVATLKKRPPKENDPLDVIQPPTEETPAVANDDDDETWDELMNQLGGK